MKKLIYLLVIFCSINSCLDPIDIKVPIEFVPGLVIQGGVFKEPTRTVARVFTSTVSDERGQTRLVRVNNIFIENDKGQKVNLSESDDGGYFANLNNNSAFNTDAGTKIRISATSFDNNTYQSSFETMQNTPQIKKLNFRLVNRKIKIQDGTEQTRQYIEILMNSNALLPDDTKPKLKVDVQSSYLYSSEIVGEGISKVCYVTTPVDITKVFLYDVAKAQSTDLDNLLVYDAVVDHVFAEQFYGIVSVSTLSNNGYNYFRQINELNSRQGSIFEPAGNTISTNIKNITNPDKPGFGYFYASQQNTAIIKIDPEDAGSPSRQCPTPPSEDTPCPTRSCCDCLILKGASTIKPAFWK